ncbi:Retrovirus-related Pol polyprotein, partial [Mucuna pruriens]
MSATIQDLKMQIGQLANTVSHLQSARSGNLPSQTIPNPSGNASIVTQRIFPLPFPNQTLSARKPEIDEELLKMFRKVDINIPLLDAIKQIPKYVKFLKELCVHKQKKMKGGLKSLLSHLKYVYLGNDQQFPEKLLHVLRQHKKAIGWKLCDLLGINTFIYNAPSTFQRCMTSIFSDLLQDCMEVFMDDFTVYADSFDACLENLSKALTRCIDTNLVLNFEKCHFMVTKGIVLGHLVSSKGIEVDKLKIDIITYLPNPASGSIEDLSRISAKLPCYCPSCYRRMCNLNLTSLMTASHPHLFSKHPTGTIHSSLCVTPPIQHWEPSWARELELANQCM